MPRILAFSGSSRRESFNTRLVAIAADGAAAAGAEVTRINLGDFPMPLMNEDLEASEGMPAAAREFKNLMIAHDGFLIASPEYNSAFSPLLKNALDWASRRETEDEPPLQGFRGKVATLMAASPGALGGLRGLVFLRMMLGNLGVIVLPDQLAVREANKAFNEDGSLTDEKQQQAIRGLGAQTVKRVRQLSG
jgi:NAD(P)H-dependent FMN reductase